MEVVVIDRRWHGLGLFSMAMLLLVTGTGWTGCAVQLVDKLERASPGTFKEMDPVCEALRKVEPFASLIGAAEPLPGWLPTRRGRCGWRSKPST
ncbi:MAG: hypothetical protein ACRDRA_04415 [Pseudonocardiaceae bacterium]